MGEWEQFSFLTRCGFNPLELDATASVGAYQSGVDASMKHEREEDRKITAKLGLSETREAELLVYCVEILLWIKST